MSDSDLFVPVTDEGPEFYTLNEEAVPMLVNEYMRQDDEGKFRMFKLFGCSAKYTIVESVLIAECMLALLTGGADAFDRFVTAEFERTSKDIIESELRDLFGEA
jgi:hypothetical protein